MKRVVKKSVKNPSKLANWKANVARDLVALGSIPFFILVLVRVYLLDKPEYFSQFVLAGVLFLILVYLFKACMYSGLGLVTLVFTMLYYTDFKYSVFGTAAYLLLLGSLFYMKETTRKIFTGLLLGVITSGASYYLVQLMF